MCKILRKLFGKDKDKHKNNDTKKDDDIKIINLRLFKFFNNQKFLKIVSYFDAIRASQSGVLIGDFDWLKSKEIDGIRILINFELYHLRTIDNDHKNLFNSDGTLDSFKLEHLHKVLQRAKERKLVVDISFNGLPLNMSETALRKGIIRTIRQVVKWGYRDVIWDLANERFRVSEATCKQLAKDMRTLDKNYYFGISGGYTPEDSCNLQILDGCNIIRYHDPRWKSWANNTAGLAKRLYKCAGNRPAYFDEPNRNGWGGNYRASDFITACGHARNAGLAAWTFHTEAGFVLHKLSFRSQLSNTEKKVFTKIGKL